MPYVVQNQGILLAPALFAASIYMTLGRLIRCVKGEKYSIVRVDWLTRAFVLGDILSFLVQGAAVGPMITGSDPTLGEAIVLTGLFIQIVSFCLFLVTAVVFHVRMHRFPTLESFGEEGARWNQCLVMLYWVGGLIMVRSIFRVVEYAMGQSGYALRHEWTMYIFDSVPMLAVIAIFYVWFPSHLRVVPRVEGVQLNENDSLK